MSNDDQPRPMMQCAGVEEIGSFRITQRPVPQPGVGEVLIRVEVAGLCRTDLKIVRVGHRDLVLPTLARLGWTEVFHRVRMGPGTGTSFGMLDERCVFCLPGGNETTHEAGAEDAVLWMITNEPELAFESVGTFD